MKRLRHILNEKTSCKTMLTTALLLIAVAATNFALYFLFFLPETGGTAYMELNLGYLPRDLFTFAEAYGAAGRRMYIAMSCTLDLLTPFLASLLLAELVIFLAKRNDTTRFCGIALPLGCAACLSDWLENICMITILAAYPAEIMAAAGLARIFTSLKYLAMLMFAVMIVHLLTMRHGTR